MSIMTLTKLLYSAYPRKINALNRYMTGVFFSTVFRTRIEFIVTASDQHLMVVILNPEAWFYKSDKFVTHFTKRLTRLLKSLQCVSLREEYVLQLKRIEDRCFLSNISAVKNEI